MTLNRLLGVLQKIGLLALLVCMAFFPVGCGNDGASLGVAEGQHLHYGGLSYQVQISRQLNQHDREDSYYLAGLSAKSAKLANDQIWFGVWILAKNNGTKLRKSASQFYVRDTQNTIYRPVPLPRLNAFAYTPSVLKPGAQSPDIDSPAATGPIGGSLLLFKISIDSLENRPLVLHIPKSGNSKAVAVDLDV